MKVAALAGGVGGAKLADGLAAVLPPEDLTIIVNTGDDFEHLGLTICPDVDTVIYTLAGMAHPESGWGRRDETWAFLETLGVLGGPTWFRLGDRDMALHVLRTDRLRAGQPLSQIVRDAAQALGVRPRVLPMSDDRVRTIVRTIEGELSFQEYFVARRFEPAVVGFRFEGAASARPAPDVVESLERADLVVLCPSNPWVSLDPILAVPGVREAVSRRPVVGVSPIISGRAVKGPAAKMFQELGIAPSPVAVAEHYHGLLAGLVIDKADAALSPAVEAAGVRASVQPTWMRKPGDRRRLARAVLELAAELRRQPAAP
ncbi:MAG TPA: 2-phospho-L-lactate transferase [Anaerolineales bacterium]|nr:2-phospho-L-lactate transferase [Anaerolineales bacterium]